MISLRPTPNAYQGIDPGSDFLYRILVRSKRRSKILYTLRNAPTQSLFNSIEVPGLKGNDYYNFTAQSAQRFRVNQPGREFIESRLPKISERRPLIIENIIALTRTCGSYEEADRLFTQSVGEEIRDYVFEREWDALMSSERSCLLLAALSEYKKPASFEELKIFLQAGDSVTKDAVGAVREMFLTVDDTGTQSMYSLEPLTRTFVQSRASSLKYFGKVREIVRNYKRNVRQMPASVVRVVNQLNKHLPTRSRKINDESIKEALRLVSDPSLGDQVTNDVFFSEYRGYVLTLQKRANLSDVRKAFTYCFDMGHEPEFEHLLGWYEIEKKNPSVDDKCVRIADFIIDGKRYSAEQKVQMISRKATYNYTLGKAVLLDDTKKAQLLFTNSLTQHLRAFKINATVGGHWIEVSEKLAKGSTRALFDVCFKSGEPWDAFSIVSNIPQSSDLYLDPIEQPVMERLVRLSSFPMSRGARNRLAHSLSNAAQQVDVEAFWMDKSRQRYLAEKMKTAAAGLRKSS